MTTTKKAAASPKPAAKSPKSVKKAVEKSPKASPKASPKKDSPKKAPAAPSPPPSPKKRSASDVSTKPKKAATAYFIWLNEVGRKDIIAKQFGGSGSDVAAISKAAGVAWGKMSDKDKAPFQAKAEKDKERYAKEMKSYVPPEGGEPKKGKKGKKGKKEKDPNKPKKPSSAYMLWLTENRAEIAKDPAVKKNTDVMKVAGEKWGKMPAAAKEKYEKAAATAKAAYDKAMVEYKANKADEDDDDEEDEE